MLQYFKNLQSSSQANAICCISLPDLQVKKKKTDAGLKRLGGEKSKTETRTEFSSSLRFVFFSLPLQKLFHKKKEKSYF